LPIKIETFRPLRSKRLVEIDLEYSATESGLPKELCVHILTNAEAKRLRTQLNLLEL